ncbi:methionyl-tRNA formyltransferase [Occultella glacieicola]|uniref:Methionyl-tRNA formyltransferase n=1 Tax=Occultella glacieicola TaxID=2518684 RepID=A0ABY2E1K8_9MICO|nr:methionyl-tRNA formyltransferase [Occultella glacieicola]TDE92505.1 methionyl-tRNA formyltransferase [Occultella glacieicola]
MRLLFAGTPAVALPTLAALLDSGHDVVGVLTRPPAPVGRKRVITPSPVQVLAQERGVPVITSDRPHDEATMSALSALTDLEIDCAPVVAYGALLREPALSLPRHGWVNLHFSLLPAWRGAAPVQHAIMAGDDMTGASTFRIEAGLDTGPVFGTLTEPVRRRDTAEDLLERLAQAGPALMLATLDAIEAGTARPTPQAADGVSLAPRLTSADARVDWSLPALALDRRIRGCTPAPGAWTTRDGERYKLGPVLPVVEDPGLAPGQLAAVDGAVLVGTGSGPVRLDAIAPPGKGWMAAADWLRGARLPADASFDPVEVGSDV